MKKVAQVNFKKISEAAKKSGLTTRAIAERAGDITHTTVHDIINGNTNPSAVNVKKVCDVIGLPINEAFITRAAA